jgi:DNA-binding MarR family transcriptional regulator
MSCCKTATTQTIVEHQRDADPRDEAIADLIFEVAQCFFRIRAFGLKESFVTDLGGTFGFIRSLALHGPLTVPQIARMRPVSRQRMQKLTDQLILDGLVELTDNPRHQRSKLVKLTPTGEHYYRENAERLIGLVSKFDLDLDERNARDARLAIRDLGQSMIGSVDLPRRSKRTEAGTGRRAKSASTRDCSMISKLQTGR